MVAGGYRLQKECAYADFLDRNMRILHKAILLFLNRLVDFLDLFFLTGLPSLIGLFFFFLRILERINFRITPSERNSKPRVKTIKQKVR